MKPEEYTHRFLLILTELINVPVGTQVRMPDDGYADMVTVAVPTAAIIEAKATYEDLKGGMSQALAYMVRQGQVKAPLLCCATAQQLDKGREAGVFSPLSPEPVSIWFFLLRGQGCASQGPLVEVEEAPFKFIITPPERPWDENVRKLNWQFLSAFAAHAMSGAQINVTNNPAEENDEERDAFPVQWAI